MMGEKECDLDHARLARELHDGIAQDLVGVGYSLDVLLADPEATLEARLQLRTLRFTVTDLIDKVRREIFFLRQSTHLSLTREITLSAGDLLDAVHFTLDLDEVEAGLDSEFTYEIYRIAQEVFRNIAVHAQATSVSVQLHLTEGELVLSITDNGIGGAIESNSQYGMRSISDRASAIGGSLEINSDRNGTGITLKVPYEAHAH